MKLDFCYDMQVQFSEGVTEHHYALMCLPRDTRRQRVVQQLLTLEPDAPMDIEEDFFGNQIMRGQINEKHTHFSVRLQGKVETGLAVHEGYEEEPSAIYKVFSQYTNPGSTLRAFYQRLKEKAPETVYDRALYWMKAVKDTMEYEAGVTEIETTAEEAFVQKKGVCQDFTHIYLSLLRLDGIAARYVVGMMMGEGESHAWAEVNCRGYWYGIDPTNQFLVNEQYIKISHGRDSADCIVSRGIFHGAAKQQQEITVMVQEARI